MQRRAVRARRVPTLRDARLSSALVALGGLVLYTLLTWLVPDLRVSWFSPAARVLLESVELSVALFAALALLMPDDGDVEVTRNAFVASLVTLALSNLVFGVGPLLVGAPAAFGGLYSFYPWLTARYVVGALFIAAGLGWPRLPLRWYLLSITAVLVVADLLFALLRDDLPLPFVELQYTGGGVLVPVSSPLQAVVIAVLPALLFGIGAWLAIRIHLRGASRLYLWVAAALAVQALSKIHEVLYTSALGPVITSADLLRILFLALLLAGALLKVRQIVVDRGVAVEALEGDLRVREEWLRAMREFTEREQGFRTLVVHELATPIATLRTFAHVLAESNGPARHPERHRTAARGVEAESQRLQELVDRMEELRGLELEDFRCDLRPVRLRPLVEDAATYARGLPGGHPVLLSWRCRDLLVRADRVRLGQALRNLLANAAHYSPERTPILLECVAGPQGWVRVAVVDQGPGIPPEERERVLRRFERGSGGQGSRGTGLGLYVASRIAEAHGGSLRLCEPEDDTGTRAVLELRRADSSGSPAY